MNRRTRPHLPLGPPPSNLPTLPTIRQRPAHTHPPRHRIAPPKSISRRSRLGHHPRELRRRIRRSRRPITRRPALGNVDRSLDFHTALRGASDSLRFPDGRVETEEAFDCCHEICEYCLKAVFEPRLTFNRTRSGMEW